MKNAAATLALIFFSAGFAVGCTPENKQVDLDDALNAFKNPTGSFSKETGSGAFSGYRSEEAESSKVSTPGASGSSGTSRTQSLTFLTKTLDQKAQCAEGEACPCESSGSFVYKMETRSEGKALQMQFDKCVSADGSGFDGQAALLVSNQPLLGLESGGLEKKAPASEENEEASDEAASTPKTPKTPKTGSKTLAVNPSLGQNLLLTAKGTAFEGDKSVSLEFSLVYEAGYTVLAIEVPDGKVVIGMAADGTAFVKAKQGSWTCKPQNGKGYVCTSTSGGEDVAVSEEGSEAEAAEANSSGEEAANSEEGQADPEDDSDVPADGE